MHAFFTLISPFLFMWILSLPPSLIAIKFHALRPILSACCYTISSQVQRTLVQLNDSYDMQLSQEQDNELQQFITAIQECGQGELESVFKEADEARGELAMSCVRCGSEM